MLNTNGLHLDHKVICDAQCGAAESLKPHSHCYSCGAANPLPMIGPVGRPVGDPPAGSSVTS